MAQLDVSELLFDPDFADMFTVIRHEETISEQGRAITRPVSHPNIVGVVTATSPADLIRRDDGQMMSRKVSVVTSFRLRGPSPGFQPDQIVIEGVTFTITEILPFTRFGSGFVEALATSMNALNAPPL